MKKLFFAMVVLLSSVLLMGQFTAREVSRTGDIPDLISFQGRLTDSDGNPITVTMPVRFYIYDSEVGGEPIWEETPTISIIDGLFQINLGEVAPLNETYFNAENRWLTMRIDPDAEMTPRIRITSVPYALTSLETDPTWIGAADETVDIGRSGYVGIGTTSPSHNLDIDGLIRIRGGSPAVGKVLTSDNHGV
ncbi:MAG: hypothetical protein K0B81_07810, partial [Candidatus Cloacimonetes bacterium]|nr:hypothetical protein [Candidatus Cloacimonadota bacterium]